MHKSKSKFKSAYNEVQIAWLNQQKCFISVLHLSTLSGRFKVGFGEGHDRVLTFRDRPRIFEF